MAGNRAAGGHWVDITGRLNVFESSSRLVKELISYSERAVRYSKKEK